MVERDFINKLFLFTHGKGQKYKRVVCTKNCKGLANRTSILSRKQTFAYATMSILALGIHSLIYSDY
jgi:hypothetical protein